MDWKDGLDEGCACEIEELIINSVKAGFSSDKEILEDCEEYISDFYRKEAEKLASGVLAGIIKDYRQKFQNTGTQKHFNQLKDAFSNIEKHGIVTQHCAGYTLSDGCGDCNFIANIREGNGEKVTGYCFYTMQDIERLIKYPSSVLYLAFGNYTDEIKAEEIGQIIVKELENAGFSTEWNNSADARVAIKDMVWDKQYSGED